MKKEYIKTGYLFMGQHIYLLARPDDAPRLKAQFLRWMDQLEDNSKELRELQSMLRFADIAGYTKIHPCV